MELGAFVAKQCANVTGPRESKRGGMEKGGGEGNKLMIIRI